MTIRAFLQDNAKGLTVVAVILGLWIAISSLSKESPKQRAWETAKADVVEHARAPKSVDFGDQTAGQCVRVEDDGSYLIKGYADCTNAFGAEVRNYFAVSVEDYFFVRWHAFGATRTERDEKMWQKMAEY